MTRSPNTYLLLISYRSPDAHLAADVANAIANSYLLQTYDLRIRSAAGMSTFMEKQLDELKAKMEQSSLALAQFEKDLDVINPEEKTNILSARLLQLNTDYTTAQTDRVRAEAAWNAIKSGSLEAAEASPQGDTLIKLYDTLDQARQHFALVKATYGTSHPEYRKAASELAEVEKQFDDTRQSIAERVQTQYQESLNREQMLQAAVNQTKAEWDSVNASSFQYQQLKQEADADKALYDELIKKIHEADINAGFQNNNIRIADIARPSLKPVFPNMMLNLVLAFLFSTLLAVGGAIVLDSLDTTLRDPEEASRFLGADVIATLPVDRAGAQLPRTVPEVASGVLVPGNGQNGITAITATAITDTARTTTVASPASTKRYGLFATPFSCQTSSAASIPSFLPALLRARVRRRLRLTLPWPMLTGAKRPSLSMAICGIPAFTPNSASTLIPGSATFSPVNSPGRKWSFQSRVLPT